MDYRKLLEHAIRIFNERTDADFSGERILLEYLTADDAIPVFEKFCSEHFPHRLSDRYMEDGYFDFRASTFVSKEPDGIDGILLRTDIPCHPDELIHVFLHELAHIYHTRNELDGKNFYDLYCDGQAESTYEDGAINAGYAVWRECIAEIVAFELDDDWIVEPLKRKKRLLTQLRRDIDPMNGKLAVSQILVAVMTSKEVEMADSWDIAKEAIDSLSLFEHPQEIALMALVYKQLRERFVEIDIEFISALGTLYLSVLSAIMIETFSNRLKEE
ncbi:MAG: hypothetical protein EUB_02267 [Eubacterium sp.]|uniref:hypothetical protein n=1 Tax=Eubacterium sp. TaxID=142586 RepID=UPI0030364265